MRREWTDILIDSFREVALRLAAVAPRVLAAVTLVVVGWIAAIVARNLVGRLLRAADLDARAVRWGLTASLARAGVRRLPSEIASRIAFWILVVIGLLMGIEALEVPATAGLVTLAMHVLPNLVLAVFVLLVGWLLAQFVGQTVLIFVVNAQMGGGPVIAAAVRWLILIFAGAVALTQLGIAREMVLLVFGIGLGGAVLALALAFGLGARDLAREALESWLRREARDEPDRMSHV